MLNKTKISFILLFTIISCNAQATPSTKIIGGSKTFAAEHQFTVALLKSNERDIYQAQFCGGTLVTDDWVITAAHCVDGKDASEINIMAGCNDMYDAACQVIQLSHIYPAIAYNNSPINHDIALLKLANPVVGATTATITASRQADGVDTSTLGWGLLVPDGGEESGDFPTVLHTVSIAVVSDSICERVHGSEAITGNMFCAGVTEGGKDSCQGDSGGPLVTQVGNQYTLVGIASWGDGCGEPNKYGVYTNVANYKTSIDNIIAGKADKLVSIDNAENIIRSGGGGSFPLPIILLLPLYFLLRYFR